MENLAALSVSNLKRSLRCSFLVALKCEISFDQALVVIGFILGSAIILVKCY